MAAIDIPTAVHEATIIGATTGRTTSLPLLHPHRHPAAYLPIVREPIPESVDIPQVRLQCLPKPSSVLTHLLNERKLKPRNLPRLQLPRLRLPAVLA